MAKAKTQTVENQQQSKSERMSEFLKKMEKDHGVGTVVGGDEDPIFHEFISTGSIGLDKAIGIGGLPRGKITEIFGPESSGKTTIAMHVMAEAHKANPEAYCGLVDVEHAYDRAYGEALGIDPKRFTRCKPEFGESALEMAKKMVESGEYDVVVLDSVAALVPHAEMAEDAEIGDSRPALQARLMSQALRILTPLIAKSNCVFIFINQLRDKPNIGGNPKMPTLQVTSGGNALKFYAAVRLDVRRLYSEDNSVMDGDVKIGNLTKIKVIKNKVAPPFRSCEFNILYGEGIDKFSEMLGAAVESGVVKRAGSWYSYGETKIGQGFDTVKQFMRDNEGLYEEIKKKVEETFIPKEFIPTGEEEK
jgi:recombination protein RecA